MEFSLLDLALAIAALAGYRMLQELTRRGMAPVRPGERQHAAPAALPNTPTVAHRAPGLEGCCRKLPRAAPHRLINFW